MVFFQSSAERGRHASTDAMLEHARSTLSDPVVLQSLGEQATRLISLIDTKLYRPNIKHGFLSKPKFTSDDKVPVLSLHQGETLFPKTNTTLKMSTDQQDTLVSYFEDQGVASNLISGNISFVERGIEKSVLSHAIKLADSAVAGVDAPNTAHYFTNRNGTLLKRFFAGAPVTMFRTDQEENLFAGHAGIHELVHTDQYLRDVVTIPDRDQIFKKRVQDELEAYHISTKAAIARYAHSDDPKFRDEIKYIHSPSLYIERARLDHNTDPNNPFVFNEAIVKQLDEVFSQDGGAPDFLYPPKEI